MFSTLPKAWGLGKVRALSALWIHDLGYGQAVAVELKIQEKLVTDMASALLGTAVRAIRKMKRKNILAQSQRIASDITTTDSFSASSLVDNFWNAQTTP